MDYDVSNQPWQELEDKDADVCTTDLRLRALAAVAERANIHLF
jgi:hypothetical protein